MTAKLSSFEEDNYTTPQLRHTKHKKFLNILTSFRILIEVHISYSRQKQKGLSGCGDRSQPKIQVPTNWHRRDAKGHSEGSLRMCS